MAEPTREELWRQLRALQERQADIRELRAWIEGRAAALREAGAPPWAHDAMFLRETKPIMDWLEAELRAVEAQLGA